MAKKQLVLAFFENEAAADEAVKAIKGWDKASKEVKLGAPPGVGRSDAAHCRLPTGGTLGQSG